MFVREQASGHHSDGSQRMILGYSPVRRYVAEHSALVVVHPMHHRTSSHNNNSLPCVLTIHRPRTHRNDEHVYIQATPGYLTVPSIQARRRISSTVSSGV